MRHVLPALHTETFRGKSREHDASRTQLDRYLAYLQRHPEVRDVIISGGDPLTQTDAKLNDFLVRRAVPTVEIIRIGSRLPIVLPYRITDELCQMLSQYHPLFMNIHVNHPDELTPEVKEACDRLTRAGIPLGSQTVLLKGINDDPTTLKKLFQKLLTFRIKPYYLYHCDPAQGTAHFRTPISRGMELIEYLMGHTSGLAVPTYVVDAPHGAGKIPIMPSYILTTFPGGAVLRNFEGMLVRYVENGEVPQDSIPDGVTGVAALALGAQESLRRWACRGNCAVCEKGRGPARPLVRVATWRSLTCSAWSRNEAFAHRIMLRSGSKASTPFRGT